MELFWFLDRGALISRAIGRGCQWSFNAQIIPSSQSVQTSQIMEVFEWHLNHYDEHGWRLVEPDLRAVYYHLYICRDGNAIVWKRLREQRLSVGWMCNAQVEFHRLHAQVWLHFYSLSILKCFKLASWSCFVCYVENGLNLCGIVYLWVEKPAFHTSWQLSWLEIWSFSIFSLPCCFQVSLIWEEVNYFPKF